MGMRRAYCNFGFHLTQQSPECSQLQKHLHDVMHRLVETNKVIVQIYNIYSLGLWYILLEGLPLGFDPAVAQLPFSATAELENQLLQTYSMK